METKKIVALLSNIEDMEGIKEMKDIEIQSDKEITIDGSTWRILSDMEADEEFREYQLGLMDDLGLESFVDWARDYIINNYIDVKWFNEAMRESYECYVEDLKHYGELAGEMESYDADDEEDFVSSLCDGWANGVDWYIDQFGKDDFMKVVKDNHLYDLEKIVEYVKDIDGRGCLAVYDGEEMELDNGYYAYRID